MRQLGWALLQGAIVIWVVMQFPPGEFGYAPAVFGIISAFLVTALLSWILDLRARFVARRVQQYTQPGREVERAVSVPRSRRDGSENIPGIRSRTFRASCESGIGNDHEPRRDQRAFHGGQLALARFVKRAGRDDAGENVWAGNVEPSAFVCISLCFSLIAWRSLVAAQRGRCPA